MPICGYALPNGDLRATTTQPTDFSGCEYVAVDSFEWTALNTNTEEPVDPSTPLAIDFALYGITPEMILFVLSWGMGYLMLMWSFGYTVGVVKDTVKKI